MGRIYIETFDSGPRGWLGWGNTGGYPVKIENGAAISESPWWIDCNHAPPGAGYLHILFALHTSHRLVNGESLVRIAGRNPFVDQKFPTDFRNARVTVRIKGNLLNKGANLALLAQGKVGDKWVNQILMSQTISVKQDWSEQTLLLVPEQEQWVQLGSRHDRADFYGTAPVEELLADVNGDIIFVLFPLEVVPLLPGIDPHKGWAEKDYPVDRTKLPSGYVMIDTVQIEFANLA